MKTASCVTAIFACCTLALAVSAGTRDVIPLDDNWRFLRGEVTGADRPAFNDQQWTVVHLPHDWTIAGTFAESNSSSAAGAFLRGGVAWYRRSFALPSTALNRRVYVEFDGGVPACDTWINGMHLGHETNGTMAFAYELPTAMLGFGGGAYNVLTVCTDDSGPPATNTYAGAGICRHVRLIVTYPVHIAAGGFSVRVSKISGAEASTHIETVVTNESGAPHDISLQTCLFSPAGDILGAVESSQVIPPGAAAIVDQQIDSAAQDNWTPTHPVLCQAVAKLRVDGQTSEQQSTTIAARTLRFEGEQRYVLNGKPFQPRTARIFPDGGAFGLAVPRSIWEARLWALKSIGINALQTELVPADPDFLSLCDRLGLLVLNDDSNDTVEPANAGDLGIDHLGDGPAWPVIGSDSGLLDRTGAVRPLGRQRQSAWGQTRILALARHGPRPAAPLIGARPEPVLLADWTPADLTPHTEDVEVYSNYREVELYLNGKSLGRQTDNSPGAPRGWLVPFAPGTLKAIAREGHRSVATNELRTAGVAAKIVLTADRESISPDWDDVPVIRANIVDARGTTVPGAGHLVSFKVAGPAAIAAVDNAASASHELFETNSLHAYRGRCAAYVRAAKPAGRITVTAAAAGLKSDSVALWAVPASPP